MPIPLPSRLAAACVSIGLLTLAGGCETIDTLLQPIQPIQQAMSLPESERQRRITREQLQGRLIGLAGTYISTIEEAADLITMEVIDDPVARREALAAKLGPAAAMVALASEPDPQLALLNMMVVASLNREVWNSEYARSVFGPSGEILVTAHVAMEGEVWEVGTSVFPTSTLVELRRLIAQWRARYPEDHSVSGVRIDVLTDLADSAGPGIQLFSQLNFLAPVNDASRAVDEARLLGERSLFVSQRLPSLIRWETQLLLYELALTPEVAGATMLPRRVESLTQLLDRYPTEIADLVARERTAALDQLALIVAAEREATLAAINDKATSVTQILPSISGTIAEGRALAESLESMLAQLQAASSGANQLLETVDRLQARRDPNAPPGPGIADYEKLAVSVARAAHELDGLLERAEQTLEGDTIKRTTETVGQMIDRRMRAGAKLAILLMIVAAVTMLATLAGVLLIVRRLRPPSG
jgi:hypothetical protein